MNRKHEPRAGHILYTGAVLCSTLLLFPGCAGFTSSEPDWVRNPKTAYPEDRYLVAVGEGDTRRAAENAAAANLSRIFESHIESDERLVDEVRETTDDFFRTTDMTTDINILSSQTLINIQHAEAWKDARARYHAVAYLNRRETAAIYRDRVEELTGQVVALLHQAEETDLPLGAYANLRAALLTARENDLLLRQLRIIHPPTASAATPPFSVGDVQKATAQSARRILAEIDIEGDARERITSSIEELVTGYGFVVGTPAVLRIEGSVSITDTGQRTAGLSFFRYSLAVQIQDAAGNVLASINQRGREGVTSPDEAEARCGRTLDNLIRTQGTQRLDLFFDSLVEHGR